MWAVFEIVPKRSSLQWPGYKGSRVSSKIKILIKLALELALGLQILSWQVFVQTFKLK